MINPNGPYPGRQLFLGLTVDKRPAIAYLVTGRSKESRERKAIAVENTVRMGPLGDVAYDPLRHYTAVKYDNNTGIAAVSNGIQTETIYEMYRLLFNVNTSPATDYLTKIMDGADAEPDSYHTPRIAGVITGKDNVPVMIVGIKGYNQPAGAVRTELQPGMIMGVSTYTGNMDAPKATSPSGPLAKLEFTGKTPEDLAKYVYDISQAVYKDDDIRVCSIGMVFTGDNRTWNTSIINAHKD